MDEVINSIKPELLIVAVLLYGVGVGLKKSKLKDNFIPLVLGGIGIVAGVLYCGCVEGWTSANVIGGCVQGLLCAAASTYVNQVIKQILKNNNVDIKVIEEVVEALGDNND